MAPSNRKSSKSTKAPTRSEVPIARAKGRPMLTWVGKRPLDRVTAFPAQLVERFEPTGAEAAAKKGEWRDWPAKYPKGGLLFHGDNKEVLAHLLANGFRGKVDLIYIDPPFDSGADYVRKVTLRGPKGAAKIDGETYTLGEQIQYTDIWSNDTYLQFMYERLLLLKELLNPAGTLWLHSDPTRGHALKLITDEVFGAESFVNQIVWKRSDAHSDAGQGAQHFGTVHDMLFVYRGGGGTWNPFFTPLPKSTVESWYRHVEPETGRRYNKADISGPGGPIKGNPVYEWKGITRAWRYSKLRMAELEAAGLLVYSESGIPYRKRYLDESKGVPLQDWWDDISMIRGIQRRGESHYPTEKPPALIERVLEVSSNPGDLVLDCFIGSGTTAAVAQKLGRRWIGCDINKGAIQTTAKRLQGIIEDQRAAAAPAKQRRLIEEKETPAEPAPAQLAFSTWRVNDYDLQIQHNEAVELACEHLGIERTKADGFFDGTLGRELVKIIPFNHPLSPLDLEAIRKELDARPDEDRAITVVSLGIEHGARQWIDDWNRLRKGKTAVNKITSIELRTDQRYGKFFQHQPASADVTMKRKGDTVTIQIDDVLSPTVIERLQQQAGVLKPRIDDWRAVVDSVMIDPAYDGEVFNVALADVPERKQDLVDGRYEVQVASKPARVAVRITDVLGEEILVVREI